MATDPKKQIKKSVTFQEPQIIPIEWSDSGIAAFSQTDDQNHESPVYNNGTLFLAPVNLDSPVPPPPTTTNNNNNNNTYLLDRLNRSYLYSPFPPGGAKATLVHDQRLTLENIPEKQDWPKTDAATSKPVSSHDQISGGSVPSKSPPPLTSVTPLPGINKPTLTSVDDPYGHLPKIPDTYILASYEPIQHIKPPYAGPTQPDRPAGQSGKLPKKTLSPIQTSVVNHKQEGSSPGGSVADQQHSSLVNKKHSSLVQFDETLRYFRRIAPDTDQPEVAMVMVPGFEVPIATTNENSTNLGEMNFYMFYTTFKDPVYPFYLPRGLRWLTPPREWECLPNGGLRILPKENTDFWQRTYYGESVTKDDGHLLYVPSTRDMCVIESCFEMQSKHPYDQAGLMVRFNRDFWFKVGLEFVEGRYRLSSVLTVNGYSDWSTSPWQQDVNKISIRIHININDYVIEVKPFGSKTWSCVRMCYFNPRANQPNTEQTKPTNCKRQTPRTNTPTVLPGMMGLFCCSPTASGGQVVFNQLSIRHTDGYEMSSVSTNTIVQVCDGQGNVTPVVHQGSDNV